MARHHAGPSLFDLIDDREPEAPIPGPTPEEWCRASQEAHPSPDDGSLFDGCRITYRDRDGRDWPGLHRFTLGGLASVELDEPGLSGSGVRRFRVAPFTLRREPAKEVAHV